MTAVVGVLVLAALVVLVLTRTLGGDEETARPQQTVTTLQVPALAAGRCVAVSAQTLGQADTAFDGEVTEVADGTATLRVSHWFAGPGTDLVTVEAPGGDQRLLEQAVDFQKGGRFLVSAQSSRVRICGLSGAYSPELAALFDEAFGG
ncbi:MAG: hypothetical protein U0R80_03005 [Nocardioidaceae bacterium]